MINPFSSWLFNLIVWGSVVTFLALLYETFGSPGYIATTLNSTNALIGAGVIAVLSLLWPRY